MNDFKFAIRQLRKSPGFTLVAVLTLALGIGLNTAIFSLINDLFLKGLPFQDPERVLHISTRAKDGTDDYPMSVPRFMLYRDAQTIFSGFAAEHQLAATVTGLGDPFQVPIYMATANWFDVLGVRPILGRMFLPQEEDGANVAIITDRFWKARYAGNHDVIGKTVVLDGVAHTIVGVVRKMPVSWSLPNADIWTTKPFTIPGYSQERIMRGTVFLRVVARMKPGVTLGQAKAALSTLENSYRSQFAANMDAQSRNIIKTLPEDVTENLRPGFATLLTAVGFVLLIACSNVANLLLVRFSGRRREISLRLALGATRASVVRLFVFESVLISLLAGILGAALAWQLVPVVPKLAANFLPIEAGGASALSIPVLVFTIVLSLVTGLAMGLYPALQTSRNDIVDALKEGGRGTAGTVRQERFRTFLVGAQVALSVTLLAGASLLIASFVRLSQQDLGFKTDNLWVGFTFMSQAQYPDVPTRARFAEQLQTALRANRKFQEVMISTSFPLTGSTSTTLYTRPEGNVPPVTERKAAPANDVTPGWFQSAGIPLLAGRDFKEQDVLDHPNVIIISKAGASAAFGDENPIGKTLLITSYSVPVEIVGVVGDVRSARLNESNAMEFYRPFAQENFYVLCIAVRSPLPPATVTRSVQTALRDIDPGVALIRPQAFSEMLAQVLGQAKLIMVLLGVFAGVALLLATVGIYGAVAYSVEQRIGEIGVRMALGAQARDVLRLVVSQGMKPVIIGLVIGVVAAFALGRLLTSQLYQISSHNPALLAGAAVLLAAIALLACCVPARRATRIDPTVALRTE